MSSAGRRREQECCIWYKEVRQWHIWTNINRELYATIKKWSWNIPTASMLSTRMVSDSAWMDNIPPPPPWKDHVENWTWWCLAGSAVSEDSVCRLIQMGRIATVQKLCLMVTNTLPTSPAILTLTTRTATTVTGILRTLVTILRQRFWKLETTVEGSSRRFRWRPASKECGTSWLTMRDWLNSFRGLLSARCLRRETMLHAYFRSPPPPCHPLHEPCWWISYKFMKPHDWIEQIGQQNLAFGLKFEAKGVIECYEGDLEDFPLCQRRDIEFKMVKGDFQLFEGTWSIEQVSEFSLL